MFCLGCASQEQKDQAVTLEAGIILLGTADRRLAHKDYQGTLDLLSGTNVVPRLSADFHAALGRAHSGLRSWEKALAQFDTAIGLAAPVDPVFLVQRGMVLIELKQYQRAISDFSNAIRSRDSVSARTGRAVCQLELGRITAGLSDYRRALELDPDDFQCLKSLVWALVNRRKQPEAIREIDSLLASRPSDRVRLLLFRAEIHLFAGEFVKAKQDLTAVLQNGGSLEAHLLRAEALVGLGEYRAAASDLSRALQIRPTSIEATEARAGAYLKADMLSEAIADYSRAMKLAPGRRAEFLLQRGMAYGLLERFSEAVSDLTKSIRLRPTGDAYEIRANYYFAQGNLHRAKNDALHALKLYLPADSSRPRTEALLRDIQDELRRDNPK